jgi:hypothetical protein
MPELVRASQIVEALTVALVIRFAVGQIPTYRKPPTLHEGSKKLPA